MLINLKACIRYMNHVNRESCNIEMRAVNFNLGCFGEELLLSEIARLPDDSQDFLSLPPHMFQSLALKQ